MSLNWSSANPKLAIERYAVHAANYDRSAERTMHLRKRTIEKLGLKAGDTVLDVACGTGLSFELLQEKIGPSGKIVGVEISPEMIRLAEKRVQANNWQNTVLIQSSLEEANLTTTFDAILFNYTHDVIRSERALLNIFSKSKAGSRVSLAGMKLLPWWLFPLNIYVLFSARPYMTTFEGLSRPWSHIERFTDKLEIESTLFGTGYIASGKIKQK